MKEFNQEEWEEKFDVLDEKYQPVFAQIMRALMFGTVLGLVLVYYGFSVGSCVSLDIPSADVGSTWISWGWSFDNATVYVDGTLVELDNDQGYYILSGLDGSSRHRIDVYDNDDLVQHYFSEDTTLLSLPIIFLILGFIIGCLCLGLLMSYMPIFAFVPATGLFMYLMENNFEGWLILFVAFLWLACLLYGGERLGKEFRKTWRSLKQK